MSSSQNILKKDRLITVAIKTIFSLIFLLGLSGCSTLETTYDSAVELFSGTSEQSTEVVKSDSQSQTNTENSQSVNSDSEKVKAVEQSSVEAKEVVRSTPTTKSKTPEKKNLEIMWQVPTEPVDAYHVYLEGSSVNAGEKEERRHIRLPVTTLKKEDVPTYGPVYKYILPDSVRAGAGMIQIRAENQFGLSEPSEPIIVEK